MKLLDINSLTKSDILQIWKNVSEEMTEQLQGNVAWSFEGNGIRTRTTFIQAFQTLGLNYVELPNFLKTGEAVDDLAGYLDPFYSLYVIRDSNHQRMTEFANATRKPVINAMSSDAHPCEVLTDAYYLNAKYGAIENLRILLWGPSTNVFKSWHVLAQVLDLNLTHFCPANQHDDESNVRYIDQLTGEFDVVITDAWPKEFADSTYSLSIPLLETLGHPEFLPVPPVTVGKEMIFEPNTYSRFSGYDQKRWLLPVQAAVIHYLMMHSEG
ncbi:ornithine carbamoyltransferase [Vibrio sp. CAIM 722]|uniref:Ornithine carbamoyltransferase n=1 Tax=Vibrio eleionomae TaxID=2653505 RepID=A0A7X4RWV4_9VIBR|nr:ornithine carbamoyltransferase [Vibrio eleionomae]MZI95770.1 ornithine carbamoyltransferase [Vibrio eleionomae]